jgi:SAM-dependent methyltransferase
MPDKDGFADRFGAVAGDYALFRPTYPAGLFELIAGLAPGRRVAWDCATGNGQAACALAAHVGRVVASDASPAQLAAARPCPGVFYVRARAEAVPLPRASTDLVTVAQALHWLDIPALWREARRVLVGDGIVAVWCYSLCRIAPEIDPIVDHFYTHIVGPFWAPQRALTDTGYRTVPFPFIELEVHPPDMIAELTLAAFLGYIGTWSATEACRAARREDPLVLLREALRPLWGRDDRPRLVRWPLHLRVGRV